MAAFRKLRRPTVRTALFAVVALAAVSGVAGSCGTDKGAKAASRATSTTSRPAETTPDSTATSPTGDLAAARVALVDLRLDAQQPIDLTFRPGSTSLLVAERGGKIREAVRETDGTLELADKPVIDLTDAVGSTESERGLLGIAVSPDGQHLYASYTEARHGDSRIDEYELTGSDGSLRADPSTRRQLLAIEQPFSNHNGGSLRFGPDHMLYAGFGDGGSANDPAGHGQARNTLFGKILRIDPSQPDGVPSNNPFVDVVGTEPLIWMTGVRNPWRIDFDPATGDLWVGDVGQNLVEEVDRLPAADGAGRGANLGWDLYEGNQRFEDPNPAPGGASAGPFVTPVLTYTHDDGCSITGGVVVRDPDLPALDGAYLFGDFCKPWIKAVRVDGAGTATSADLGLDVSAVVSFARGPNGEIYVVSLDGTIARLKAA